MAIYLDYAATAPLREEALQAMLPFMQQVGGNPSAMYGSARTARAALEDARSRVARCLGAEPSEIFFTSGGTESNNWVLQGLGAQRGGVVTTCGEHHAVLDVCAHLEKKNIPVTYTGLLPDGTPDLQEIAEALQNGPALVSVIYANNEVGTLSPVREIAGLARDKKIPFHTDAVAAVGKVPVHVHKLGVTLLSASGHKFGGPRGTGILYVQEGVPLPNLLFGGRQERGGRPGTENVAAAVGLASALESACSEMQQEMERLKALRDILTEQLKRLPGLRISSPPDGLASLVHVLLPGIRSEAALVFLDSRGIECAAGAACSMGASRPSHVLTAMGIPPEEAACALRISMGGETQRADIDRLLEALEALLARHRSR